MDSLAIEKIPKYIELLRTNEKVGHVLRKLENIPVTFELLSKTGVGKVVNRCRNHPKYGALASEIVNRWKEIVKKSEENNSEVDEEEQIEELSRRETKKRRQLETVESSPESDCRFMETSSTSIGSKSSASGSTKKEAEPKIYKKVRSEEYDPFAAELAAVDQVKNIPKSKKPRPDPSIMEAIERQLLENSAPRRTQLQKNQNNLNQEDISSTGFDLNQFRARNTINKVYAGKRKAVISDGQVPKLYDLCLRTLKNNIDSIEETGSIPYEILKPVLEICNQAQLARIELKNEYLVEDTDELWERFVRQDFPNVESNEMESWKKCFYRLTYERNERLKRLSQRIGNSNREAIQPQRKTMLADPIAPKNARSRQIKNGIVCSAANLPNAAEISRSRRQIFETGSKAELQQLPKAVRNVTATLGGTTGPSGSALASRKPIRGALMVKTLKMMKGNRR